MRRFLPRSLPAAGLALGLALLLGGAFMMPMTLYFHWIDRVPGVSQAFCPESGRIAPRHYQSRTSRPHRPVVCLDVDGRRVEGWSTHNAIVRTVWAFWTLMLAPLFYFMLRPLFAMPWRDTRRR
ncbi:MAG: hypothetical protein FJX62_08660 [Alphaproteobacteria bacterium]|nr:hypothetical protein [Alphaproteobacteria bacterium]